MKELIIDNIELIITILTMGITWSLGKLSKLNPKVSNKLIPLQNILVMIISTIIYYWATGDISMVVASGSPIATLIYDTLHSLKKGKEEDGNI